MRRIGIRRYIGAPNERVNITTAVTGSGSVRVAVDGVDLGDSRQFPLGPNPGDEDDLSITLVGAPGETCTVRISPIDGGFDPDILVATTHDPFPVHHYEFIVVATTTAQGGQ